MLDQQLQTSYGNDPKIINGQMRRYQRLAEKYKTLLGPQEVIFSRAPGRVDLLGSHTDYHEGYVLTMALDRDTLLIAGKRDDVKIVLRNMDEDFPVQEFRLDEKIPRSEQGSWENYVKAAAQAFTRVYGSENLRGMNVLVDGRAPYGVPLASGLSSSSALLVAAAGALAALNDIVMDPKPFARFCGEAEWYVGTRGGFMDHLTSVLNQKGTALFLDCRPVEIDGQATFLTDNIPLPPGYDVAICNTHVTKEKSASSDYNTRALECKLGVELLKSSFPDARFLRDIPTNIPLHDLLPTTTTFEELHQILETEALKGLYHDYKVSRFQELRILQRCQHVISENSRVLKGCELLQSGDMQAFGKVMIESYTSMRDDFEASCDELEQMIAIARHFSGTVGARIAGAGWGGCAVAIVKGDESSRFQTQVTEEYVRLTGIQPDIFLCHPGQGATLLT